MFLDSWPVLAAAALFILISTNLIRRLRSPVASIPGPLYTKFTSLWLMRQEFIANRRPYIHQLHEKYGPVVRLGPNEVSFSSGEAIKEIYASGGSGYDKTEFYTLFKQFGVRTMFSTLVKGDHSQKKRYIAGQYANTNIMRPQVMSGIQDRADVFVQQCRNSAGMSTDAYVSLHCYALDCATHHLFHPHGTHSLEREEDLRLMKELSYHNSLQRYLCQYYFPDIWNFFMKFSKPKRSPDSNDYVLKTNEQSDLGECTLLHKLQASKDFFQKTEMAAECMDHMAAGIDTTGDGLCLLMHQMSLPESQYVQKKLFEEFNQEPDKPLDELPYLDAVVKEGLRCFPPIPMSQPRYVPSGGRTIDGYFVPMGTIVSCQAWTVHRLNEAVYPNGEKFIPERWLEEKGSLERNRLYFAFSSGGRGCTGKHLAIAEMKVLLKEVYSRFTTTVADDMVGSMELSDQVISSRPLDQTCKLVFTEIK
ncbi:hypothetical protein BP6252_04446 [Coleophoma cylindrospora]|uniref:Cytochrome P450 n=1 Tax=Coleophoma cylindrospora TaxID=1849047 RepID=A0A3D8S0L1_9HELO|nr:hypothetical protein BP6252_04446 [Coleophoma cylindrospora]